MKYYSRYVKEFFPSSLIWFLEKALNKGLYKREYDRSKALFIHIPKNAGVSVSQAIYGVKHLGHNSIRNIYRFDPDYLEDKIIFYIARHPYTRFMSAYNFARQNGSEVGMDPVYVELVNRYNDVNDFILNWLAKRDVDQLDYVFKSQSYFVSDRDYNLLSSNYFRLEDGAMENIQRYLSESIGLNATLLGVRKNESKKQQFQELSNESKAVLYDKYRMDFINFEYD